MYETFNISPEIIRGLSTGIGGAIVSGVAVSIIEKAKQKRLKRDNKRLVQEAEEIKSTFNRQLEELKRDHQLDIAKRKNRYETKTKSYIEFFSMLDTLNSNLNTNGIDRLKDVLEEYNRNATNANTVSAEKKALIVFQKKTQALIIDSNKDLVKLRHETNSIKITASDEVVMKLDYLEKGFEMLLNESNKLISKMAILIMNNNEEAINIAKEAVMGMGMQVEEIKKDLIRTMRVELNDI